MFKHGASKFYFPAIKIEEGRGKVNNKNEESDTPVLEDDINGKVI